MFSEEKLQILKMHLFNDEDKQPDLASLTSESMALNSSFRL